MAFPRASGILLHPSSLPSRGGIGDFGPAAYRFVDFLTASGQAWWQVLPLGPLGEGFSPYSSTSAFAGNPLLISLERLVDKGYANTSEMDELGAEQGAVDYESVLRRKTPLLEAAAARFLEIASARHQQRYQDFCSENAWWLEDFVLFDALRAKFKQRSWIDWPRELARREDAAMRKMQMELAPQLAVRRVLQFWFHEQWRALRQYCNHNQIRIVGDIAIFVNYDSADVWSQPELFRLDRDLRMEVVSGVPPDFFSQTGQRWGNPLYNWDVMQSRGYDWWIDRLRWATHTCDYIRLDHFRGFEQCWEIPAGEETAIHGRWVDGPRDELFNKLQAALGGLPFFAEDLGYITPEVNALRERHNIPGIAVLQFGFGDAGAHIYLPHTFTAEKVVYTGTHDNDTIVGWWRSGAAEHERRNALAYLGNCADEIHWAFIRAAETSVAHLCIVPLQDVFGLGSEGRMNVPSQSVGNWSWRYQPSALTSDLAEKLKHLVEITDRLPQSFAAAADEDFAA